MTQRLVLVLQSGVVDAAFGTVLDVAGTANRLLAGASRPPAFEVRVCAPVPPGQRLASGLTVSGLRPLPRCGPRDWVVIPGANHVTAAEVAAWLAGDEARRLARWIARAVAAGARVHAGCTATFLAAEAGVLDGGDATTTWWLAPLFAQRYPHIRLDARRVLARSGAVTTAGAAFAHADLMLALVEQAASVDLARQCARYLLLDTHRVQASFPLLGRLARADDFTARAERWALQHLDRPLRCADWARALHTSERTLARRLKAATGMSPLQFLQRARIERAAHLIETTTQPIEQIAASVGYGDAATLRRLLRRELGTSPRGLRGPARP